jgi:hypothetical protein
LEEKAKNASNVKNAMKRKLADSTTEKPVHQKVDKEMKKKVENEMQKGVEKEVEEKECTRMHKKLTVGVIAMNKDGQVRGEKKSVLIVLLLPITFSCFSPIPSYPVLLNPFYSILSIFLYLLSRASTIAPL